MATISFSRASVLPLVCLLLAAAAKQQQQEQPTPALPPITLAGCPDKCGNVSIPYPFGTKDGCFRPGFFVVCNDTFDPPRPFINSSLAFYHDDGNTIPPIFPTQIVVENLYNVTSKDGTPEMSKQNKSVWPIQLVDVSLLEGKARLLGAFSYECSWWASASNTGPVLSEGERDCPPEPIIVPRRPGNPDDRHCSNNEWQRHHHRLVRRQKISFDFGIDSNNHSSPFVLSPDDNVLMGIGLGMVAEQTAGPSCSSFSYDNPLAVTYGDFDAVNGSCSGQGCCQANLLYPHTSSEVTIQNRTMYEYDDPDFGDDRVSCSYAMIVEKTWYNFSTLDLDNDAFLRRNAAGLVPIVADFIIHLGPCPQAGEPTPKDFACISDNSKCVDRRLTPHSQWAQYCVCSEGYQGNPYMRGGCQDIDECARPDMYPCHGNCKNTPGDYECSCPAGTRGDAKKEPCTDLFPLPAKISVGMVGGLLIIALLVFIILIRNEKRKMTEFFSKNGGPTLEKAKIIKIYKKGELNPILKPSNFIGRGAFGEVYKGFLDNQLVAVKKPIDGNVDVAQNDQFANEVIIQSQVVHKNIVRLIGCCLEVDKPMLVYEFLSQGSLDDILHGSNRTTINLECRLNIAAESAEGLSYLHSKTTNIILHGDVKPANILLNDSFTPKISDFGISRLIVIDKEHTDFVIGDRTYMDPVYLRDGLLTDKSDVYSFGVVLLELISRKKATYVDNNSLVRNFLDAHKSQKEATELFDKDIAKPEVLTLLNSLYEIAVNCLDLDVDKRPNMTEVAERLRMLKRSWSNTLTSHVPID